MKSTTTIHGQRSLNVSIESFSERRAAMLRKRLAQLVVPPGGTAHTATTAEYAAATQEVSEAMLDEIHFMLRVLIRA